MATGPRIEFRDWPDTGTVSVHDEDLLTSVSVNELIEGNAPAVG